MNDTLSRIKAEAERRRVSDAVGKSSSQEQAQRRHEAALPLFKAFADVQDSFVRIDVLKRIWPSDYQRRPDRARGLLIGMLGGERQPYGLSLYIPGGQSSYQVEAAWDGKLLYVSSREVTAMRPQSRKHETPQPWLADFYLTMSSLLEL
jgi:hypothetical protein